MIEQKGDSPDLDRDLGRRKDERHALLDRLIAESEALGLYEDPLQPPPLRGTL